MFENPDLPLALIMEEILGWEKKPGQKSQEDEDKQESENGNNQRVSSTYKKF